MKFIIDNPDLDFKREESVNDLVWVEFTNLTSGDLLVHVGLYNDEHGENMTMIRLMQAWGEMTKMLLENGKRLGVDSLPDDLKRAVSHMESADREQVKLVDTDAL